MKNAEKTAVAKNAPAKNKVNLKSYIMIIALLVIVGVFSILTDGIFVYPRNISTLARQTTVVGIISIAMMFIIIANHIDLSIGVVLGCCGTICAVLHVWLGWSALPTVLAVLVFGGIIGTFNGFWVAYRKVPAFIATLGTMLIAKGIRLGIGQGQTISPMDDTLSYLGTGYLSITISWILGAIGAILVAYTIFSDRNSKAKYGIPQNSLSKDIAKVAMFTIIIMGMTWVFNSYRGFPVPVIILVILAIIFNFVATKTNFGRSIYAIGGNEEAANLAGIKTKKVTFQMFVIGGVLAAAAGIVMTTRLDAATASAGDGMELDAIASCVIGGVSMSGGTGSIPGVMVGALIMAALDNGMSLINLESFWQFIVKGIVLVLAVWADQSSSKKK